MKKNKKKWHRVCVWNRNCERVTSAIAAIAVGKLYVWMYVQAGKQKKIERKKIHKRTTKAAAEKNREGERERMKKKCCIGYFIPLSLLLCGGELVSISHFLSASWFAFLSIALWIPTAAAAAAAVLYIVTRCSSTQKFDEESLPIFMIPWWFFRTFAARRCAMNLSHRIFSLFLHACTYRYRFSFNQQW